MITFVAPEKIESSRLIVRPVTENDLADLMAVNGDDEVTKFLPYATWKSLADAQAWYKRMCDLQSAGGTWQFVIVEKQTNLAIGSSLLFRFDAESARAEIGYVMGRAYWRNGYTSEALTALINHAFEEMSLRRIEAEIDPRNVASAQLLKRLRFAREGLLRQRWVAKGQIQDSEFYGLLRHDWQASRNLRD